MPCQSYDSSWDRGSDERKIRELKKQADMLARIACKAMAELEENQIEDLLLLKDDEVRIWWQKHKEDDAREQARVAEIERRERVKAEALAKLSSEEQELLGLAKPQKSSKNSRKKRDPTGLMVFDVESMVKQLNDIYIEEEEDDRPF